MENKPKKLKIENFKKINKHLYKYKHTKGGISTINLTNETCTCYEIVDKSVCIHLVCVALLEKHNLNGMVTNDKFSTRTMRRIKQTSEDKAVAALLNPTTTNMIHHVLVIRLYLVIRRLKNG